MTKALAWVRKSKGDDDDIGLQTQRSEVFGHADELAAAVERVDLGVHTGFSTLSRDDDGMLDDHPEVAAVVDALRAGEYDYLVALDDRRICRDGYLQVIQHAATAGDCVIRYVRDVADDDLTHDIKRRVERDTKEEEIEKSKAAIAEKQRRGHDLGPPKFGMEYGPDSNYQVPGENFDDVVAIFERRADGDSLSEIADATDTPRGTVYNVLNRKAWYRDRAGERMPEVIEA